MQPGQLQGQIKTNTAEEKETTDVLKIWLLVITAASVAFASRVTNDPVEAVLLTHAAFTSTRQLLRTRDEVRFVTILLTAVMRDAQLAKLRGADWATRVHANKPVPEPKNRAERRRCSPRCPICLEAG